MAAPSRGPDLARAYLDAFVSRDYAQVRSLLTSDFRLRDLSPGGFTQVDGADEAMAGLREFLDMLASLDVIEADAYDIPDVTYLRARVHFVHAEAGERYLEQHHLLRIADGRITGIDQLCTGLHVP
jgi:ketosteroid isomerase-like protein